MWLCWNHYTNNIEIEEISNFMSNMKMEIEEEPNECIPISDDDEEAELEIEEKGEEEKY